MNDYDEHHDHETVALTIRLDITVRILFKENWG
jgi:hypothetical protein